MYNENDYQVVSTYKGGAFKENILNGAMISVKGAGFRIERVYTKSGKPTHIFEFVWLNAHNSSGELIEIGWNNSPAGLQSIGDELGLDYKMGSSIFSNGNLKPHFVEVIE